MYDRTFIINLSVSASQVQDEKKPCQAGNLYKYLYANKLLVNKNATLLSVVYNPSVYTVFYTVYNLIKCINYSRSILCYL